jgi:hypothetical protein
LYFLWCAFIIAIDRCGYYEFYAVGSPNLQTNLTVLLVGPANLLMAADLTMYLKEYVIVTALVLALAYRYARNGKIVDLIVLMFVWSLFSPWLHMVASGT